MITVTDDGCGIRREDLPHIFEPFYASKPSREEAQGLGLATVYGIVKQNLGCVWVYSEPECDTVFKVYFPCVVGHNSASESDKRQSEPAPRGRETILVVEDEAAVRVAAAEYLRRQGYHVIEAKDGVDALMAAKKYVDAIDLLVTDVVMPNVSGGELAKEFAHLRRGTKFSVRFRIAAR